MACDISRRREMLSGGGVLRVHVCRVGGVPVGQTTIDVASLDAIEATRRVDGMPGDGDNTRVAATALWSCNTLL